jgi:flagellar L-ring protein precursor FlgH
MARPVNSSGSAMSAPAKNSWEKSKMNTRFLSRCSGIALLLATCLPARADSLWHDASSAAMVADRKAHGVGDLLTIIVQENSQASKDNTTKTAKESKIDASLQTFLYSPTASSFLTKKGHMPALQTQMKNDFNGGGTINNSEQIIARVAVQVIDVLPNRQLIIEGKRQTSFSGESQDIVLRGVVRPDDIGANNTVFSYNIADATVKFVNKGAVSDTQRRGWFSKIWDFVTPF